jgi:peptidoglycan-N-acetylglucosamine deacetylase
MQTGSIWHPYQGAVSLTFDDGTQNQLEKVVPALNERQIKATFYIHPYGDDWQQRLSPWQQVAAAGHEIGNHTLSHVGPANIIGAGGGLEDMTIEQMESDILLAQKRLMQIAPGQAQWTFCYPCYCTFVGKGASQKSYVPLIAKHFVAGRTGGEYGCANHPQFVDLASVWGLPTDRMSGYEMIGLAEELTSKGLWLILVFHEIDGSRLTIGSHDFYMLLDYLKRKEKQICTAPVIKLAQKIATLRNVRPD